MKKLFSLILAGTLALSLCVAAHADGTLTDVTPGSWYYNEVSEMVAAGYIDGYEDGTFGPERTVTVIEAVTMTARMTGAPVGEADGFWGGLQLEYAYQSGWISESDVAPNAPETPVTRELASKIVAAALGLGYPAGTELPFSDADSVGESYKGSVLALYSAGLLNGYEDGTLRPQDTLTRAQAASLLYRAVHMGDGSGGGLISAAGYAPSEIINYFCDVALGAEYGETEEVVIRWGEPVRYHIGAGATEADLQQIYSLIDALNKVPGFPGFVPAASAEDAALTVSFVDTAGMEAAAGDSFNGYVTLRWALDGYGIVSGQIYYNTELDQGERNAVIVEELVQSLGLLNDTYDHPESIFYQYHTDTSWPTTLDWAVIQLLYSDGLTPGMDEQAVRAAAEQLVR